MRYAIIILMITVSCLSHAQQKEINKTVYDFSIPKTIEKCFEILDKTMPEDEILLIKTLSEESIYFHKEFQYGTDFFHAWKIYDNSKLTKYFNKKGLYDSNEIYETILIAYHRYLNQEKINIEEIVNKYNILQKKEHDEYLEKLQKDSLNGVYIPQNLEDCSIQLNKLLSKKDIQEIKNLENKEATIKFHYGLGTWIRNNWCLWGGSRLQKYFMENNIKHPDDMSAAILEYYYEWLNDKNEYSKKCVEQK
jgi:hypothetical protein